METYWKRRGQTISIDLGGERWMRLKRGSKIKKKALNISIDNMQIIIIGLERTFLRPQLSDNDNTQFFDNEENLVG